MATPTCSDEEFIVLWNKVRSSSKLAKILNLHERNINARRRNLEKKYNIQLLSDHPRSNDFKVTFPANGVRVNVEIDSGTIVVASDCHYYPGVISPAHRAFISIIKEIKPKMVVMNGDVFDGASISRHPATDWQTMPTVKQELDACQERLNEIEKVAKGAALHWTWGNHDMRFNARLCSTIGDTFRGLEGMNLMDHFPMWKFSTSIMVNENTVIKHRWHNGIHAVYNNALKSGTSIVTGHLHSLKVTPWTDYRGTRYGVDTGTLSNIDGSQFDYVEDNPKNWRSGFAVLTFHDGKLLPPELCEVINDDFAWFRGKLIPLHQHIV